MTEWVNECVCSGDGGNTVHADDARVNAMVENIMTELNLKVSSECGFVCMHLFFVCMRVLRM